jgi:uncharacterized integral membrane protein
MGIIIMFLATLGYGVVMTGVTDGFIKKRWMRIVFLLLLYLFIFSKIPTTSREYGYFSKENWQDPLTWASLIGLVLGSWIGAKVLAPIIARKAKTATWE